MLYERAKPSGAAKSDQAIALKGFVEGGVDVICLGQNGCSQNENFAHSLGNTMRPHPAFAKWNIPSS